MAPLGTPHVMARIAGRRILVQLCRRIEFKLYRPSCRYLRGRAYEGDSDTAAIDESNVPPLRVIGEDQMDPQVIELKRVFQGPSRKDVLEYMAKMKRAEESKGLVPKIYNTVLYNKKQKELRLPKWQQRTDDHYSVADSAHKLSVAAKTLLEINPELLDKFGVEGDEMEGRDECEMASGSENRHQFPFSLYKDIRKNSEQSVPKRQELTVDEDEENFAKVQSDSELRHKLAQLTIEQKAVNVDLDEMEEDYDVDSFRKSRYGTPNPTIGPSKVACGGCGAFLHCQDTAVPGYIPSEVFVGATKAELRTLICQRCYFLKEYNMALNVSVSPEEYPNILSTVRDKVALVILIVDLLDFPCSIWPDLSDIIGTNRPICVVGNKVDLLPKDSSGYLTRIKTSLIRSLKESGIDTGKNIKHICLVSAKTGYGIEELITKLQNSWSVKGDVYLIGCTNVGKSSLFNALIQSDYCQSMVIDVIQRATVSPWPGTTLNLLKFPILRPTPWRLYLRTERLIRDRKGNVQEQRLQKEMLQETGDPKYATLISHIGQTFYNPGSIFPRGIDDPFAMDLVTNPVIEKEHGKTFNADDYDLRQSKWCYDTPGSIQHDQIINLLTLEELKITLPKEQIRPRTYAIKSDHSLLLAGLGRIDYIEGDTSIRVTVFASKDLPVTIIPTDKVESFYQENLGTEALGVPMGGMERLKDFPPLIGKDLEFTGLSMDESCGDIILSSAGWVGITLPESTTGRFKAFTPEGRGCYAREPALLQYAVMLRGKRSKYTPFYSNDKIVI